MKRFIRYLYEYQDGQRIRNVGFVKVEQDWEQSVIHIHGKGLRLEGDRNLSLFLILDKGKECMRIYQGDIENVNPAVNYRLIYGKENTGTSENYDRIDGLVMENSQHRKFAAVWDDMPVDVENMKLWEPEREEASSLSEEPEEEVEENLENKNVEEEEESEEEREEQQSEENDEMNVEKECKASNKQLTKIKRQDLSKLPRSEWRLANNSFLLHGYYNYHHLLLIEEDGYSWIGVPGVFHPREASAAEAFGFPQFVRIGEDELEWGRDEKNLVDDFGYWCRQVRR